MTMPKTMVIVGMLATLGSAVACGNEPSGGQVSGSPPFELPAARRLQVASTAVTPLGSAWRPEERLASPPREVAVETATVRFIASVETKRTGLESTVFRIVLRARARQSGGPVREHVIEKDAVNLFDIAWAPGGSMVAFCEGTLVSAVGWSGDPQVLYVGPGGPYPGACTGLAWSADGGQLQFIQLEHATDTSLANPARVTLELKPAPSPAQNGAQP